MNFKGTGNRLQDGDFQRAAEAIGVEVEALRAVVAVEARGSGFDKAGRPKMLFEPHKFYATLTGDGRAAAVRHGVAYPHWGEKPYPKDSYGRLDIAVTISPDKALASASWGLGQIMGAEYANLGYGSAAEMVEDAMASEGKQLDQMVGFIKHHGLVKALQERDWTSFARRYNGPGYKKNRYDTLLAKEYTRLKSGPKVKTNHGLSDDQVKAAQEKLKSIGYNEIGSADGKFGSRTTAAVSAFQHENDLPTTGQLDSDTLAVLHATDDERPISEERANAKDVPGSRTMVATAAMKGLGGVTVATGAITPFIDQAESIQNTVERVGTIGGALSGITGFVASHPALLVVVMGGALLIGGALIAYYRLQDHRSGRHV